MSIPDMLRKFLIISITCAYLLSLFLIISFCIKIISLSSSSEVAKSGDGDVLLPHHVVQPLDVCPRAGVARPQPPGLGIGGLGLTQLAS